MHHNELRKFYSKKIASEIDRPIFKISYKNRSLYRRYSQGSTYGIGNEMIGLFKIDLVYLTESDEEGDFENKSVNVELAKWYEKFIFFYNNPRDSVSLSIRLIIWGIPIAFVVNILSAYFCKLLNI